MAEKEWRRYFWSARTLRCAVFARVDDDDFHSLDRYEDCLFVDAQRSILPTDGAFGDLIIDLLNGTVQPPDEGALRRAARALMLQASARASVVTVPETLAIDLLHALPDVAQVPHKDEATGEYTWTTEAA